MSRAAMIAGPVIVDVEKKEYDELVAAAEKIATVKRFLDTHDYVSTNDIKAILDIKTGGDENVSN